MKKYDYSKLRGLIAEKYKTLSAFSEVADVDKSGLSLKLNNRVRFNQDDIVKISRALGIRKSEIFDYFFRQKN